MKVDVIDSPCGSGKTRWAIKYMKENRHNTSFLYVTPFLNEVERVIKETGGMYSGVKMKQPNGDKIGKYNDLLGLVKSNESIGSTHALLQASNKELLSLLEVQEYELILDEVMQVVRPLNIVKKDVEIMTNENMFYTDENEVAHLTDRGRELMEAGIKYSQVLKVIDSGNVQMVSNSLLVWIFPVEVLRAFKKITIMTYMFNNQAMSLYLKANGCSFTYYHIDNPTDLNKVDGCCSYSGVPYSEFIDIYEGKLNNIGNKDNSLSMSWFKAPKNIGATKILSNNAYTYFRREVVMMTSAGTSVIGLSDNPAVKAGRTLWTVPSSMYKENKFNIHSHKKSFIAMNSRATNDYSDRDVCAYLVNRFESVTIRMYLEDKELFIDEDVFALSEMIQWVFRSSIRKGVGIDIYIPSKRMRQLFSMWLNGDFDEYITLNSDERKKMRDEAIPKRLKKIELMREGLKDGKEYYITSSNPHRIK